MFLPTFTFRGVVLCFQQKGVLSLFKRDGTLKGISIPSIGDYESVTNYRVYRIDPNHSFYPIAQTLQSYKGKSWRNAPKLTGAQSDSLTELYNLGDDIGGYLKPSILDLLARGLDFHGVSVKDVETMLNILTKATLYRDASRDALDYYFTHFKAMNILFFQIEHAIQTFGIEDIYEQNTDTKGYNIAHTRVPQITYWILTIFQAHGIEDPRNVCYKYPVLYIYCILRHNDAEDTGLDLKSAIQYGTYRYPELVKEYIYRD